MFAYFCQNDALSADNYASDNDVKRVNAQNLLIYTRIRDFMAYRLTRIETSTLKSGLKYRNDINCTALFACARGKTKAHRNSV